MPVRGGAPWLIVQHVPDEGPGLLADALHEAGIEWAPCRVDLGQPLPTAVSVQSLGGLVVMGGPMSVHDTEQHPWLVAERALLVAAVEADIVVLGVCLGAQQLAMALGAEVWKGDNPEIGQGEVTLSDEGLGDPVLGPVGSPLPCLHWHADTFGLPAPAVHLASSDRYPNQAFRVGRRAYGLQFHVEVDAHLSARWAPLLPAGTALDPQRASRIEAAGRLVLGQVVALAGRP